MSKYSNNFKAMITQLETDNTLPFKCCEPKISIYNNNNLPNISNNMRKSMLLQNSPSNLGGGIIRYGNFGNLLNATVDNNNAIQELVNILETNQENDNDVYIDNITNTYSQSCNEIVTDTSNSNVNYTQFYQVFNNLNNVLNKNNNNSKKYCKYIFHKNNF